MKKQSVKGYKIFDSDFECRGFKFEEGKSYKHSGELKICSSGFHFCLKASHCFNYYDFDSKNIICEVEAFGDVQYHGDDSKACTNHIKIGKRLSWEEVLKVANEGANNTGHSNTGDRNTGYRNTGDRNTGYRNTGYRNTGDRNTGDRNTGDRNTGDWNTGDRNTGYCNTGDSNTGVFCTGEKYIKMFNKPSKWNHVDFANSEAYRLLCQVDTKLWIYSENMTEEEKKKYPSHSTTGGYLKDIPFKEAFKNRWHNWSDSNKKAFTSLPNFSAKIFEEITGIKVKKHGKL